MNSPLFIAMSLTVWLAARTLNYPNVGGHLWVYLNWALGLRALGCKVVWLEPISPNTPVEKAKARLQALRKRLQRFQLADFVSLCSSEDSPLSSDLYDECLSLDEATGADLLVDMVYGLPSSVVRLFRRSVLLDIDPGLLQIWISKGNISIARYDSYFTIGETVGQTNSAIPDCGLDWYYTPPCIALEWWPVRHALENAPFTTVSNWIMEEWMEDKDEWYANDKRSGFLPFLDLPRKTTQPLELALHLKGNKKERMAIEKLGWEVRESHDVASTPDDYQHYIQQSRGEFSCVKPSCIRLPTAWISDRTLCYLASGKPAVVQHTGVSRFLPDSSGIFRFRSLGEAASSLDKIAAEYDQQCKNARALAEEFFDANKVISRVLDRAMA
jgi:hypothetical protein